MRVFKNAEAAAEGYAWGIRKRQRSEGSLSSIAFRLGVREGGGEENITNEEEHGRVKV